MYSEHEPRNWKWALPAVCVPVEFLLALWLLPSLWSGVPLFMLFVCALMAINNFQRYNREWKTSIFEREQAALAETPVTKLADALQQMHPDAEKLLNKFAMRTAWQVKVDLKSGDREFVLAGANVHYAFIQFVLDHSNPVSLMPKRLLSEGSKKFDPDGLMTDYEQYDAFQQWLVSQLVVTRPFGDNHPCMFLPPWNVDLLAERMGFNGMIELEQPEEDETIHGVKMDDLIPLK